MSLGSAPVGLVPDVKGPEGGMKGEAVEERRRVHGLKLVVLHQGRAAT